MVADDLLSICLQHEIDHLDGIVFIKRMSRLKAKRAKIKEIILSEENRKNINEIDKEYLKGLTFHYVSQMHEVLDIAITNKNVKNYKKLNV